MSLTTGSLPLLLPVEIPRSHACLCQLYRRSPSHRPPPHKSPSPRPSPPLPTPAKTTSPIPRTIQIEPQINPCRNRHCSPRSRYPRHSTRYSLPSSSRNGHVYSSLRENGT